MSLVLAQRVFHQCDDHNVYNHRIYAGSIRASSPSPNKWCTPPEWLIKINTNASLSEEGMAGLSVVARDSEGKVLFAVEENTSLVAT